MNVPERRPSTSGLELVRWIGWAQQKAGEDWFR
ncbi:MAG: MarR family transcriptional regulator, partial [Propionibacteriaceae bacterium]